MMNDRRKETKEWVSYAPFERILESLWERPEPEWKTEFTRKRLRNEIESGALGKSMVATYSPPSGSVEEILENHRSRGEVWIDVQNLCYHYSWQNPKGNYRSRRQMLDFLGGRGTTARYRLRKSAFDDLLISD